MDYKQEGEPGQARPEHDVRRASQRSANSIPHGATSSAPSSNVGADSTTGTSETLKLWRDTRAEREALCANLRATGSRTLCKAADAIAECGKGLPAGALLFETGERAVHRLCRHRLCPACSRIRQAEAATKLLVTVRRELEAGSKLAVTTLTIQHSRNDKLIQLRTVLGEAWKKLTQAKKWRDIVADFHCAVEVERTSSNGWHPHLHVLIKLRSSCRLTWTQVEAAIRDQWFKITAKLGRPSNVVRVEKVKDRENPEAVVAELCKYLTKRTAKGDKNGQVGLLDYTPEQLAEYAYAIRHWKLHRASRRWAKPLEPSQTPDKESGAKFWTWFQIKETAAKGADGKLSDAEVAEWEADAPRIIRAFMAADFIDAANLVGSFFAVFMRNRRRQDPPTSDTG